MEDQFFEKIKKAINEHGLISENDRLVVGVSGGADSVCLFHILRLLGNSCPLTFHVLHVHHSIRGGEADRDAAFVQTLCENYGVPFNLVRYDVPAFASAHGMTVEEAGRILRREAFERKAAEIGGGTIVLAHHMNDVAETVLFNLARGSGVAGLASLRYKRGGYIRPLLGVSREEIVEWLGKRGFSYCSDSTNEDCTYSRNFIRNKVLPELTANVNSRSISHIFELSEEACQVENWLSECAKKCLDLYAREEKDKVILKKEMFRAESEPVYRRAVKMAVGKLPGTMKDIERVHINMVCALCSKENGKRADLPYGLTAESVYDEIIISRKADRRSSSGEKTEMRSLPEPGHVIKFGNMRFLSFLESADSTVIRGGKNENVYTKKFDYDKISGILEIRYRRPGDYLVIHPDGRRKSLSNLFTDRKIPREERDMIPLLACGQEVLWAVGIRSGESCRIDSDTETILTVKVQFTLEGSDDRQD